MFMWSLTKLLSHNTQDHTLASINRVIIVVSGQMSSLILFVDVQIFIDAKEQRKQENKQKNSRKHPESRATKAKAANAKVAVVAAAAAATTIKTLRLLLLCLRI